MDEEPEISLEERQKYIEELQKFTDDFDNKVKNLCSAFGFDFDELYENRKPFIICPFNKGHGIPEQSIERHLKSCEWNSLGYTKDCKPLPESALPEDSPSTVKFDMELQHKVLKEAKQKNPKLNIGDEEKLVPQTSDRLMSDFTVDERRAMYDYVIANTVGPNIGSDITNMNQTQKKSIEDEKNATILELLAQERNLKRRRAKYKGVHTNKKSHVEIMREVVEQQMEMYKEYISEKYNIPITENENSDSHFNTSENDAKQSSSKFREYLDNSSFSNFHKNKSEAKYSNEKFNKNYKYDYDKNQRYDNYKTSSHYKDNYKDSSKNQDSRLSQKVYDRKESRDWSRDDKHSQDRNRDFINSRSKADDRYGYARDRKRSRSRSNEKKRDSERDRSRSNERKRDKRSRSRSNERKRSRRSRSRSDDKRDKRSESQSNEKNCDSISKDDSVKQKSHKKHKKEHKLKKNKSKDNSDDRSHKRSKHKHKKRSRSHS